MNALASAEPADVPAPHPKPAEPADVPAQPAAMFPQDSKCAEPTQGIHVSARNAEPSNLAKSAAEVSAQLAVPEHWQLLAARAFWEVMGLIPHLRGNRARALARNQDARIWYLYTHCTMINGWYQTRKTQLGGNQGHVLVAERQTKRTYQPSTAHSHFWMEYLCNIQPPLL